MATAVASRNAARRWGPGTAAIARLLIAADGPLTGVAIAGAVGVTQPRASQVLKQLVAKEAVRPTPDGYVARRARLLDLYGRRARPQLVQPETYWYGTVAMAEQARRIRRLARDLGVQAAFSADLGPDLLIPWRHPTQTILYADAGIELDGAGLVRAEGRADASVIVRWTSDWTLLAPAPPWATVIDEVPLTDPTQQWWDLLDLGGEDRHEAAERLRKAIVSHSLRRAR